MQMNLMIFWSLEPELYHPFKEDRDGEGEFPFKAFFLTLISS